MYNKIEEINEVGNNVEIDKGRNMNILTMLTQIKIDKNMNGVIGVNNTCRTINWIISEWTEKEMATGIVDKN